MVPEDSISSPTRLLIIPPKTGSSHFEALLVEAPTDLSAKVAPRLLITYFNRPELSGDAILTGAKL